MAQTPSTMMPLGTKAPDFNLVDSISGQNFSLNDIQGSKGFLTIFICNHCPFVKLIEKGLAQLGKDYKNSGIGIVAISSNDVENYPEDSPEKMKENAKKLGYSFPYLYDETQEVAKAYRAACTPDIFLFDKDLKCVYRGQFDSARPGNSVSVTGEDLRRAMDWLLKGEPVSAKGQTPSIGCNIKWK